MQVRQMTAQDWPQVHFLWEGTGHAFCAGHATRSQHHRWEQDPELFLVAETGGTVVGTAVAAWDGEAGWVCSVAVDPRFRRMGIARNLVGELEARLRHKGASLIFSMVPRDNAGAQDLFETEGFAVDETRVIMMKRL